MRGATRVYCRYGGYKTISTHTPHAGRDKYSLKLYPAFSNFYSHAPCGARRSVCTILNCSPAISTHTPHAGRDDSGLAVVDGKPISTHTPHAGRDRGKFGESPQPNHFYSHAPCGARQLHIVLVVIAPPIYKRRTQKL